MPYPEYNRQRRVRCDRCSAVLTPFRNAQRTLVTYACPDGHVRFTEAVTPTISELPRPLR
jgi:hypothetical protein